MVADEVQLWHDFVVLAENRSAVRAARRVMRGLARNRPGVCGSILIHGPSGTGKSALVATLIQAVTSADDTAGTTIRCSSALELPRRSVGEESGAGPDEFAEHLLCDLLIVEDLHHLPPKSVDSLCRLIDSRASRRRPTILTANLGPAAMKQFPRRLTSRLAGGLSIRMDLPGIRSRKLLVRHFAERRGVMLEDAAAEWLAGHCTGGIRPMLGAIEQIRGQSQGRPQPVRAEQLREWLQPAAEAAPLERIVDRVAAVFGVKPADLLGHARHRNVLVPRQVAMYLSRLVAGAPLTRIAAHFGGRDHTTILHALQKMETALQTDSTLAGTVRELQSEFQ